MECEDGFFFLVFLMRADARPVSPLFGYSADDCGSVVCRAGTGQSDFRLFLTPLSSQLKRHAARACTKELSYFQNGSVEHFIRW